MLIRPGTFAGLAGSIDVWLKQKYCARIVIVVFPIHTHSFWSLLLSLAG